MGSFSSKCPYATSLPPATAPRNSSPKALFASCSVRASRCSPVIWGPSCLAWSRTRAKRSACSASDNLGQSLSISRWIPSSLASQACRSAVQRWTSARARASAAFSSRNTFSAVEPGWKYSCTELISSAIGFLTDGSCRIWRSLTSQKWAISSAEASGAWSRHLLTIWAAAAAEIVTSFPTAEET